MEKRSTALISAHDLVPCNVCKREIPRAALSCLYCGHSGPASPIPRKAKKRRNPARRNLGALIQLAGLVSFFYYFHFPMNLVVGLTALVLGAGIARAWQCDRCHARTDRNATSCPRCALPFAGS